MSFVRVLCDLLHTFFRTLCLGGGSSAWNGRRQSTATDACLQERRLHGRVAAQGLLHLPHVVHPRHSDDDYGLLLREHHPRGVATHLPDAGRRRRDGVRRRPAAYPFRVGAQGRSGYESGRSRLAAAEQQPGGRSAAGHQRPAVPQSSLRARGDVGVKVSAVVEAHRREDDAARRRRLCVLLDTVLRRQSRPHLLRLPDPAERRAVRQRDHGSRSQRRQSAAVHDLQPASRANIPLADPTSSSMPVVPLLRAAVFFRRLPKPAPPTTPGTSFRCPPPRYRK